MASSQVDFAAACILRDINQRNQFRDANNHKAFQKNNKDFLKQRVVEFVLDENINSIGLKKSCAETKSNKIDDTKNENFDEMKRFDQCGAKQVPLDSPRASSLVQIWEERLRRSSSLNKDGSSRENSGCSSLENVEETPRESFSGESDTTSEWSSRSGNSDVAESERVRVAEIVKKLSNVDGETEGLGVFDQVGWSPRIRGRQAYNELLVRMETERRRELDALVDRHAVSKFKHRKRIQSSLRLSILQSQMTTEGNESTKKSNSPDVKRSSLGSNIMQLRAKFSMGFGRCMTFPGKEIEFRRPKKENRRNNQHKYETLISSQLDEDKHHPEAHSDDNQRISPVEHSASQSAEDSHKETNQSSDFMHGTGQEANNFVSRDSRDGPDVPQPGPEVSANLCSQPNENSHHQEIHTAPNKLSPSRHHSDSHAEEAASLISNIAQLEKPEASNDESQGHKDIPVFPWQEHSWNCGDNYSEDADEFAFLNNWEGSEVLDEETNEELLETNYDWIDDIARPRSYWEHCRKSRYQEVLSKESNNEIRQLLERGTVSSFLTSDLRDRIDRLMESRIQETHPTRVQEEESEEGIKQWMLSLNRDAHTTADIDEARDTTQEIGTKVESEGSPALQNHHVDSEEGDTRSQQKCEYREEVGVAELSHTPVSSCNETIATDFLDQYHQSHDLSDHSTSVLKIPSETQMDSWNYQNQRTRTNVDQAKSTTSNPHLQSESYDQETRHNNSMCSSSIDAEVINDLRGKMEQMHQEMLELKNSVKICMDMQYEMQQLYKQGVHSVTGDEKHTQHKGPKKDCCCICYRKQVDSLLYRCGHMCTCLECANELHSSNGKCPICQASIDDVVKPYTDPGC